VVELNSEQLECFLLELLLLLLEQFLLTSEVVVKNDLLLQVVKHLVADLVRVFDALGDGRVSHLEAADLLLLHHQVLGREHITVLFGAIEQFGMFVLHFRDGLLEPSESECFFENTDRFQVIDVFFVSAQDLLFSFILFDREHVTMEV